jgi:putative serine/threonine protein kinase
LSQQNVSSLDEEEVDIRSPRLVPLITYPHYSECEYKDRIIEMESLGITSIVLGGGYGGRTIIQGASVAGKGCVGIVVKSKTGSKVCALKIRRTDADRKTMDEEARLHRIANRAGVGPLLEGQTKNLIAMEFVNGQSIIVWALGSHHNNNNNSKNRIPSKGEIRAIGTDILDQCFSLDMAGLDHGELSRLARHVIIAEKPYIIDFESASNKRKTCNVTAAAQSIFLFGAIADRVRKILGNTDRQKAINALRTYKHFQTRANFDAVIDSLFQYF